MSVNRQWDVEFTGLLAHVFIGGVYWTTEIDPSPKDARRSHNRFDQISMDTQQIERLKALGVSSSMIQKLRVRK